MPARCLAALLPAYLPDAARLAPAQDDVIHLAGLNLPPLQQARLLQPDVGVRVLEGVQQKGYGVVGPALKALARGGEGEEGAGT